MHVVVHHRYNIYKVFEIRCLELQDASQGPAKTGYSLIRVSLTANLKDRIHGMHAVLLILEIKGSQILLGTGFLTELVSKLLGVLTLVTKHAIIWFSTDRDKTKPPKFHSFNTFLLHLLCKYVFLISRKKEKSHCIVINWLYYSVLVASFFFLLVSSHLRNFQTLLHSRCLSLYTLYLYIHLYFFEFNCRNSFFGRC